MGKILLIEDDSVQVEMIKKLLGPRGHVVLTARNGKDGIAAAAVEKPQLILMDMIIPGMHGLEATIKLKDDPATRGIPIIALTIMSSPKFVQECYRAGVAGYIKKPFEPRNLLENVESILGKPERTAARVLIVGRVSRLETMIEMRLLRQGFEVAVLSADDVRTGSFGGEKPSVIFVDVSLPEKKVEAVFEALRAAPEGKGIPAVVFASGAGKDVLSQAAARYGVPYQLTSAGELGELLNKLSRPDAG